MSRRLEWTLALALMATLSVKLWAATASASQIDTDPSLALGRALAEAGFDVEASLADTDPPLVPATRDDCRLLVARASPLGWHRSLFERYESANQTLSYAFRDELTPQQDVLETSLAFFHFRLMRYLGIRAAEEPVWAILAAQPCSLEGLPWKPAVGDDIATR
ncbi:hypothetical protein [Mesorhizobium sp. CAU 1732]|uniref:hypothetical protein n=1 Tax=Mesorhizobium sp. CAU 1732 TaxID=3140358 RepID=UPI0032618B1A